MVRHFAARVARRLRRDVAEARERRVREACAVVTHNEVNDRHGSGILVQRLVRGRADLVSLRANSHYDGEHVLPGPAHVTPPGASRAQLYRWALRTTRRMRVRRIVCVPLGVPELTVALALHDAHGAELCLYLMDDANVATITIPDALMEEAIAKASLRLAISSDMQDAYEAKYGRRFWLLPPTLPEGIAPRPPRAGTTGRAVIVGNVWGLSWMTALRRAVREAGLSVDWYANAGHAGWHDGDEEALAADGIRRLDPLPETALAERLRDYEVALLPTVPAGGDENLGVARLSLPSRVTSILAATDLPVLVVGDPDTCAARFVTTFGIGGTCAYEGPALREAVAAWREPEARAALADAATALRHALASTDLAAWLERALRVGRPPDDRFEGLRIEPPRNGERYVERDPEPLGAWLHGFTTLHAAMRRLAEDGWRPSFVIDAGSSTGVWSDVVARVFGAARYVLVEPIADLYDADVVARFRRRLPAATHVAAAVGARAGRAELHLDAQLYASSLHAPNVDGGRRGAATIPVTTLDAIAEQNGLAGRGLLKLDVQGAELEALAGAERLLAGGVDVIVVEATVGTMPGSFPSWRELDERLADAGFALWDSAGEWREPGSGRLLQMDLVYRREERP